MLPPSDCSVVWTDACPLQLSEQERSSQPVVLSLLQPGGIVAEGQARVTTELYLHEMLLQLSPSFQLCSPHAVVLIFLVHAVLLIV